MRILGSKEVRYLKVEFGAVKMLSAKQNSGFAY